VTDADEVQWDASGQSFAVRVCRSPTASRDPAGPSDAMDTAVVPQIGHVLVDRLPLVSVDPVVRSVTQVEGAADLALGINDRPDMDVQGDRAFERLAGTLVHRLMQCGGSTSVERLARSGELVDVRDTEQLFLKVTAAYQRLAGRSDVRAWLAEGQAFYEVPFSFVKPGEPTQVVRGSIDCLIVSSGTRSGRSVRVLEFKTGASRPEHGRQLETYLDAVRHLFPEADVHGELVYPERED
jgi:hypothetical protein